MKENAMKVVQTYSSAECNEFSVYNEENVMIGYYVVYSSNSDIEVYHNLVDEDFNSIDYVETNDEALELIITSYM